MLNDEIFSHYFEKSNELNFFYLMRHIEKQYGAYGYEGYHAGLGELLSNLFLS